MWASLWHSEHSKSYILVLLTGILTFTITKPGDSMGYRYCIVHNRLLPFLNEEVEEEEEEEVEEKWKEQEEEEEGGEWKWEQEQQQEEEQKEQEEPHFIPLNNMYLHSKLNVFPWLL